MLAGSGWMESYPQRAPRHPRHQDGGRAHGRPQLDRLVRHHERGHHGPGLRHGLSRGHRHGVELGRRARPGRGPRHRAAGEGPGAGHDPGAHGEHRPHAALGPELRGLRRGSRTWPRGWASPTSGACRARASSPRSSTSRPTTRSSSATASTRRSTSARSTRSTSRPSGRRWKRPGVWAVMTAYNKVNGQWCAENPFLLTETLRKRWGFKGFVVSDWGSTYSTAGTINAGMDLEMPGGEPMRSWLARPADAGGGQRRRMAHRGEGAGRGRLGRGEAERGGRQRAPHPARHVHGRPLRPAARRRRRGGHAGAAGRGAQGGHREHGAAEERGRPAAARPGEDALRGGDRTRAPRWRARAAAAARSCVRSTP